MSGTSLVLLAMYATVGVVAPHGAITSDTFPYVLALLMTGIALACAGTVALYRAPNRSKARGAVLPKARRLVGPRQRRI